MNLKEASAWAVGVMLVMAALLLWANHSNFSNVQRCDQEIKATLKAPATYERVSPGVFAAMSRTYLTVEYDAENSFGAPIRSKARCIINGNEVTVYELD